MTDFFKLQGDSQMDIAANFARGEMQFSVMNTELRRRGSHDIPTGLLHGSVLATVGPELHLFGNV